MRLFIGVLSFQGLQGVAVGPTRIAGSPVSIHRRLSMLVDIQQLLYLKAIKGRRRVRGRGVRQPWLGTGIA
jgi:hypothetical protein